MKVSESVFSAMQMDSIALKADSLISENISNPELSVKFIADKLFISTSYLYRCSVYYFGVSLSEHIANRRLEKACELIAAGDLSLSAIAHTLSFCSQSYFSSRFKQKYGVSPLQYSRNINQTKNDR